LIYFRKYNIIQKNNKRRFYQIYDIKKGRRMISGKAQFLIAMPALEKSIFTDTVIIMAEMEDTGALGFIINIPTGTKVNDALKLLQNDSSIDKDIQILFGGPVQTDFFWFIHSNSYESKSTIKIHPDIHLSSALEILPLLNTQEAPEIYFSGVGYSGWGVDQLNREIEEGVWWMGEFELSLLFDTPPDQQWNTAIKTLGADPEHLIDLTDPLDPIVN
jgi:putative transcriptional regulator